MTLFELLRRAAAATPDARFLTWPAAGGLDDETDRSVTYAEALQRVNGLARHLSGRRIGVGDRIAVLLPSGPDLAELWFAAAALGAVLVPLDPRLTDAELRVVLAHADPALAVVPAERAQVLDVCRPRHVLHALPDAAAGATADGSPAQAAIPDTAPLAVLYTSGSTGTPKGCLLTHLGITLPTAPFGRRLQLSGQDVVLHVLPLHHMAGVSLLAAAASVGAHVVLRPRFSGSRFWRDVARHEVTVLRHLGEMLAVLCARPDGPGESASSLRVVYGGGASRSVAERFTRRFGVAVVEGYGLSETNTVLCNRLGDEVPGTLGEPLPHVSIRLVDADGRDVAGAGTGELWIARNGAMMLEYFRSPALTRRILADGWFRTGDLVRRDAQGRLWFAGRTDEVIRRRGQRIDPAEIEEVLQARPEVRCAAAVGVPDEVGGTELAVFVEPAPGAVLDGAAVLGICEARLAAFKHPRAVHLLDRLPRTSTEKVNRARLRTLAAQLAASSAGGHDAAGG